MITTYMYLQENFFFFFCVCMVYLIERKFFVFHQPYKLDVSKLRSKIVFFWSWFFAFLFLGFSKNQRKPNTSTPPPPLRPLNPVD